MKPLQLLLLLLIATFSLSVHSQQRREKIEQVHSLKIAFITGELALTPDEAAKFWPVYNAYEEKQKEIRRKRIGAFLERSESVDAMTDKEAASALSQMESNEEDLFELRKKFIGQLKPILSAKKIIKLKKAEEDFSRKLLKQYRQRAQSRR